MAWPAGAQNGAVLTGTVRDASGVAVPGVVVTVTAADASTVRVVVTNEQGDYSVDDVMSGQQYVIDTSHREFHRVRLRLTVAATPQVLDLRLKPKR
jgi:hypothetical protein